MSLAGEAFEDPESADVGEVAAWIVDKLWMSEIPEEAIYYIEGELSNVNTV